MILRVYNTLSGSEEAFQPLDPANVRMYVCGPTVYDFAHIGNARPAVVFDVLYRLLRHLYGPDHVTYVRNITDVDDKIINRAEETGEAIDTLTARTAAIYQADVAALGCLPPTHEPRATRHIADMVAMIQRLIDAGHAYAADGHVLFDVASFAAYGGLSRRDVDEMIAGARVEVAPYKRNAQDFVLWKPSEAGQPGWDSPWGRGRPGWHLECSAMSGRYLGETFDIHGGGQDLIFPHHENEIAQSVCAHSGAPFVRYWLHNGYLMTEGEKMSKSLGNFYTIHDLLADHPGEAIRLALLQVQYRRPLDFTREGLATAKKVLDRFYLAMRGLADGRADAAAAPEAVVAALGDDLNTPQAIAALHGLLTRVNKAEDAAEKRRLAAELRAGGFLLGLLQDDPEAWLSGSAELDGGYDDAAIDRLLVERRAARKVKDFATADRIRADLTQAGVIIEDTPQGSSWRRA